MVKNGTAGGPPADHGNGEDEAASVAGAGSSLADRSTRLGASLLDLLLVVIVSLPGVLFLVASNASDDGSTAATGVVLLVVGFLAIAVYQVYLLVTRGQSVGKRLLRIKIVKVLDETLPGFVKVVLLRGWLPGLIFAIPYVGWAFWLADALFIFREDRRCVHDLIAETKVIKA